jgi:hypothetical protein
MYKIVRVRDSTCRCEWTWRSNSALTIKRPIPISADKRLHQSPCDKSRAAIVLNPLVPLSEKSPFCALEYSKATAPLLIEDLSPSTSQLHEQPVCESLHHDPPLSSHSTNSFFWSSLGARRETEANIRHDRSESHQSNTNR